MPTTTIRSRATLASDHDTRNTCEKEPADDVVHRVGTLVHRGSGLRRIVGNDVRSPRTDHAGLAADGRLARDRSRSVGALVATRNGRQKRKRSVGAAESARLRVVRVTRGTRARLSRSPTTGPHRELGQRCGSHALTASAHDRFSSVPSLDQEILSEESESTKERDPTQRSAQAAFPRSGRPAGASCYPHDTHRSEGVKGPANHPAGHSRRALRIRWKYSFVRAPGPLRPFIRWMTSRPLKQEGVGPRPGSIRASEATRPDRLRPWAHVT